MLNLTSATSSFHNTSSSPTILVATNAGNDKTNLMHNSGLDLCRNFQHVLFTYRDRFKFIPSIHDYFPRPSQSNNTQGRSFGTNNT